MEMLLYFLLGAAFILIVQPVIDGLIAIITQFVDFVQNAIAAQTYKIKKQYMNDEEEPTVTHAIGFHYTPSEEEDEEYEEEIEEKHSVGFKGGNC